MYTVGLDVDTHFIMNNLAAGVLGLKNYKNSSSHNFLLDLEVKDPDTSPSFRTDVEETSYFSGLLNHYTSSEGLLEYCKVCSRKSASSPTSKQSKLLKSQDHQSREGIHPSIRPPLPHHLQLLLLNLIIRHPHVLKSALKNIIHRMFNRLIE